ncbi:MAG: right-handed parallel beta-helix repeat-containing protein [Bdellovibrionales bacterium]|nr:right-handed parallel beta-helix repeat-containing protein [Bdellovibrionales bacterium]
MIRVGSGTFDLGSTNFNLNLVGTEQEPIWIVAQEGATPILERNTTSKNIVDMGNGSPTRYLVVRGFEMRGGSAGVRMHNVQNVWFDQNEIHSTGDAALTTNTFDTANLYITRNHIHHTSGTGEGMYLGANNGVYKMRDSIIALNHVHDTLNAEQGDGIELKQGSFNNWIARNFVHDTKYPCILVYGTDGAARNVIEGNIAYNSQDNVMQVQGEALVINNFAMNGGNAFYSNDHQGTSRDLHVIHNTFVNTGTAARLNNWTDRPNMIFANNAAYSQNGYAIQIGGGSSGVALAGNVTMGLISGTNSGFVSGNGLTDFVNLSFGSVPQNAFPAPGSALIGAGNSTYSLQLDLTFNLRATALDAGALDYAN